MSKSRTSNGLPSQDDGIDLGPDLRPELSEEGLLKLWTRYGLFRSLTPVVIDNYQRGAACKLGAMWLDSVTTTPVSMSSRAE